MVLPALIPFLPTIAIGVTGAVGSAIAFLNGNENRKLQKKLAEDQLARSASEKSALAKRSEEIEVTRMKVNLIQQLKTLEFQAEQQQKSQEFQEKLARANQAQQLKTLEFQAEQQQKSQELQEKLAKINQYLQLQLQERNLEHNQQIEEFRQEFNLKIHESGLAFQRWRMAEEHRLTRQLQQQMAEYNRETQLLVAEYQRETSLKTAEANKLLETWPLNIMPSQILGTGKAGHPSPIRVLLAPPDLSFDKFGVTSQTSIRLEKRLGEGLRQFLEQYYPVRDGLRPVELLDRVWDSKRFCGGASIKSLFGMLQAESVLVLESELDGDLLNLRFGYWASDHDNYTYQSILSNFAFFDLMCANAIERAKAWKPSRDLLVAKGKDPEAINPLDTYNLGVLEEEMQLAEMGVDVSQLPKRYKTSSEDINKLCAFLLQYHIITAATVIDLHYLCQADVPPILPQYLATLGDAALLPQNLETLESLFGAYHQTVMALQTERPYWIPDILLDLGQSWSALADKTYAQRCLQFSLQAWLGLRSVEDAAHLTTLDALLAALQQKVNAGDQDYVLQLNALLSALQLGSEIDIVSCCFERAQQAIEQQEYGLALWDLSQALELSPDSGLLRYHRGWVQRLLQAYAAAIADLTQVINQCPTADPEQILPLAYEQRGLAQYGSREYKLALADLDRAIALGSITAKGHRDMVSHVWAEVKAHQLPKEELFNFETVFLTPTGEIARREQRQARSITFDLGNGVSLEMVAIPGGSFMMGSPESEEYCSSDEGPQHPVTLQPFYLGKYPVTQEQYEVVMGKNPSNFKGAKRPVECVSWDDAQAFCAELRKKTQKEFRLPSEAEWEYACRAGTTTPFHCGETILTDLANYNGNFIYGSGVKGVYRETTTPVDTFPPNAFGLYDMHGNVWEWCQDSWHDSYEKAPTDGSAWVSRSNSTRVLRGGSWIFYPRYCRSASRRNSRPVARGFYIGFRIVSRAPRTQP